MMTAQWYKNDLGVASADGYSTDTIKTNIHVYVATTEVLHAISNLLLKLFSKTYYRQQLRQQLTGPIADEFQLTDPGVLMKSFCRYNSFRNAVSASDLVLAAQALIDSTDAEGDQWMRHFNMAYDALGLKSNSEEAIAHGMDMAITLQKVYKLLF